MANNLTIDVKYEEDNYLRSLKQLLICSTPYLKENRTDDVLSKLESIEKNFDKLEIVQMLRSQIDDQLGAIIEQETERNQMVSSYDNKDKSNLIGQITESVLNSSQYQSLSEQLKVDLQTSSEYLLDNFEKEFADVEVVNVKQTKRKHDILYSETESSFGEGSSLNQSNSSILFVNNQQLLGIAKQLLNGNIDERKHSFSSLLQIPTTDINQLNRWSEVSKSVFMAITDENEDLWIMAMKFISRGLAYSQEFTKELYSILIDYLSTFFKTSALIHDIDLSLLQVKRLLKAIRLMNDFQRRIPQYWIRIANGYIDMILEKTIDFIAIDVNKGRNVAPLEVISLIDYKANWFTSWIHGYVSRQPLLEFLKRKKIVIEKSVSIILRASTIGSKRTKVKRLAETPRLGQIVFTKSEIDCAFLMHSLSFMTKLLKFSLGRKMFPLKVDGNEISLESFIISVLNIILKWNLKNADSPPGLAVRMIKNLVSDKSAEKFFFKDPVLSAIVKPFSIILEDCVDFSTTTTTDLDNKSFSDRALIRLTDIIAVMASNTSGRLKLLYGENSKRLMRSRSAPAHILAQVVEKSLKDKLSFKLSSAVLSNILYVCRQIYSNAEGLAMFSDYKFPEILKDAWQEANRKMGDVSTPTPSDDGDSTSSKKTDREVIFWEDNLLDNLLSIATTPRGVLMLYKTGALEECIVYMHKRWTKKLQVSKMQKFGYGYLLSQIVATAPGIRAILDKTDYVKQLCETLWGFIECANDDIVRPKPWQITTISKYALKSFNNLLIVTSSYSCLYEMLEGKHLPVQATYSLRDLPSSVESLFNRIVLIDNDEKRQALFNYEETHVFGLRWLSVLISCLDSLLLLQSQYRFDEILVEEQTLNIISVSKDQNTTSEVCMNDILCLERSHVLARALILGGPTERILPERQNINELSLQDKREVETYVAVCSLSNISKKYVLSMDKSKIIETELTRFLNEEAASSSSGGDSKWLEKCKSLYLKTMHDLTTSSIRDLLEKCIKNIHEEDKIFPQLDFTSTDGQLKSQKLSSLQENAVKLIIKYGQRMKLVNCNDNEKLIYLLKKVNYFLSSQPQQIVDNHPKNNNSLKWVNRPQQSCDWFVAIVFLIFNGNLDRCWKFLQQVSSISMSAYVWPNILLKSVNLPVDILFSGISTIQYTACQKIELIMEAELPQVASAFKMSGTAITLICEQWIRQCFLNYMDWNDITQYIATVLLFGVDYVVYVCVAVLKHLRPKILENFHSFTLLVFLKEEPFRGFRMNDYMQYMRDLEEKYRLMVLPKLRLITYLY